MKSFFEKLRKRHVFKVGIGYVLFAWVILQVADITLPAMGFPDWSITLVLNLLALGFPVAIVIALIFDLKSLGDIPVEASAQQALTPLGTDEPVSQTEPDHSIAVLPFPDLSAEHDQEHFCDGLTE